MVTKADDVDVLPRSPIHIAHRLSSIALPRRSHAIVEGIRPCYSAFVFGLLLTLVIRCVSRLHSYPSFSGGSIILFLINTYL